MAKLRNNPIQKSDIEEYLDGYSDYSFEIKVFNSLQEIGLDCLHAGSYTDPVSGMSREFDIRAKYFRDKYALILAVECKNLNTNYPLLIHCSPRNVAESFHEYIKSKPIDSHPSKSQPAYLDIQSRHEVVEVRGEDCLYDAKDPVGKSCDQIGRSLQGDIISGDQNIYSRWSQALSSASDLVEESQLDGPERVKGEAISYVVPIVVVPDNRLWAVKYGLAGEIYSPPSPVDRCSYKVMREYDSKNGQKPFTISHLEFVTFSGLAELTHQLIKLIG